MSFITCCKSIIRTGISRKTPMSNKQESAAGASWTIVHRPARWFSQAMSASRSPAISRRSGRHSSRDFDRLASGDHFGEPFAGGFAHDDVVHRQLAAISRQGAIEFTLRHRRHLGDDRPIVAFVSALENLAVGIDGVERRTTRPRFDGKRREQSTLAVGQAAEETLPGIAAVAAARDLAAPCRPRTNA